MKFEDLQKEWQAVKSEPKSHDELRRMMYAPRTFRLKMPAKDIAGLTVSMLAVTGMIYYKLYHDWLSVVFLVWFAVSALDRYLGLRYWSIFSMSEGMEKIVMATLTRINQMIWIAWILNMVIWFVLVIILGKEDSSSLSYIIWGLMLLPLLGAVNWWNAWRLAKKRKELETLLRKLNDEDPLPVV